MSDATFSRRHLGGMAVVAAAAGAATVVASPMQQAFAAGLPWFDVRDYGAVGNGTADDTTAVQDAINAAAAASGGGVVLAPTGTYKLTAAVSFPAGKTVDLVGSGRWQTRFNLANGGAGLRFGAIGGTGGASTGRTGGFWVNGGSAALLAMNISESSNRSFYDIQVSDAAIGLAVEGVQNAVFEGLWVHNCSARGLVLDYGAGGNVFIGMQLRDNDTNLVFQNSDPTAGAHPYNGRPTDNKFVGGIIEGAVTNHVDHMAGVDNYFFGTRFGGSTCPRIKFHHQVPAAGDQGSFDLNLISCYFVCLKDGSGNPIGVGIEHTAPFTTIRLVDCKFSTMATAFVAGNGCFFDLDAYNATTVTNRFANASGATDPEEILVRHETFHTDNITRPAATDTAFRTWVGTGVGAAREGNPRYAVKASGDVSWGPGTGAADVTLKRSASGILQSSGKLTAVGGLGVGNSAAASTPGSVVKKIQIFDANGTSLGFVPVYNTIT